MTRGVVAWESLPHLPLVLAAAVACVTTAVVVYRPQLRRAGWFWRWAVPGFRATAIAALLASVLRPSILRPAAPEDVGAVVVVLDDSASMAVTDSSWTPAELVAVADALGDLPAGVARWSGKDIDDRVARIRPLIDEAARAASELEYARVAGRSADAASRRSAQTRDALISAARSLAARAGSAADGLKPALSPWADVAAVIDAKGRAAWAELRARADATAKAVVAYQAEADARLYAQDARVRATCDGLARLSRIDLARRTVERALMPHMSAGVPLRVVAASNPTSAILTSTGAATRPSVPPVPAEAAGPDNVATTIRLLAQQQQQPRERRVRSVVLLTDGCVRDPGPRPVAAGGPPVIACRTAPAAVRDVAIRHADTPETAYAGVPATVRIDLRTTGYAAGTKLTAKVACDGTVETRDATAGADGATVEVPFRPTRPGTTRLTVSVDPLPGEATAANNVIDRYVRVLPGNVGVLAVTSGDSAGGGGFADLLAHAPGIAAKVVAADPARASAVAPADILARRVVVLRDVSAESLSPEQVDAIRELVTDRGGTLVLAAGRSHWPLDDESESLFNELLPYRMTATPTWRSSFGRSPAPAASAAVPPALVRIPTPGRFLQLGDLRPDVRPLVVDQDTGAPLLTEAPLGNGRVITVTADDSTVPGDAAARPESLRFWTALLHYASSPKYAAEADGYGLETDRPDAGSAETVAVRAKVPAAGRAGAATRPPAVLVMADGRVVRTEPLTAAGADADGEFTASVGGLPGGDYSIRLDTGIDDELSPILEVPLHVRPAAADELADVTPDPSAVHQLVEPTGGTVLPLTGAGRLAADALRGRPDRPQVVEYALWDSPYLFLFVTACLTTEWALRKRLGLA